MITPPAPPSSREINDLIETVVGAAPTSIEYLRSGAWSSVARVQVDGRDCILRFSQIDDDFRRDAVAASFRSGKLPIPQVHEIGRFQSGWWCLTDHMPGTFIDDLACDDMVATLPSLAEVLIALHEVDSSGSQGYGSWDAHGDGIYGSFAEQLLQVSIDDPARRDAGWSARLALHPHSAAVFDAGVAVLLRFVPYLSADRHPIHMDMLNRNVTVLDQEISGIFDWGCGMWGDSVYDLAWFSFWNPWYPQWSAVDLPKELMRRVGIIGDHAQERLACCKLHIALDHMRYYAVTGNVSELANVTHATRQLIAEMD